MSSNDEKIEELRKAVDNAENIVFFGGAGVSTESGLPDFRGEKDYTQKSMISRPLPISVSAC